MREIFNHHLSAKIQLEPDELDAALKFFTPRALAKREFLLREGEVCQYHAFVETGILRSFSVDEKGKEYISAFAFEGYWLADLRSFCSGAPSRFSIDALEQCRLLLISLDASEKLCLAIPKFERFFRILYQRSIGALSYKLDDSSKMPAKQRYEKLVAEFPDIVNRVAQYHIASFLGITPESLSRIRNSGQGFHFLS